MAGSPFEPDVDPRPSVDGQREPPHDGAVTPAVRASPHEDREDPRTEDTLDEPGYGHGV